jgi:hypothetical protein
MPRPSIFAEVATDYANSSADSVQWLRALLTTAGYYFTTPASSANSYQAVVDALTAAGVGEPVLTKVKQLFGSKLNPQS